MALEALSNENATAQEMTGTELAEELCIAELRIEEPTAEDLGTELVAGGKLSGVADKLLVTPELVSVVPAEHIEATRNIPVVHMHHRIMSARGAGQRKVAGPMKRLGCA